MSQKHILLYGLSANPPTGDEGHRGIVKYLVEHSEDSDKKFNEIWILPVYQHASSSKRNLLDYEHRMEMCRLNFLDLSKGNGSNANKCTVSVSNYERDIKNKLLNMEENSSLRNNLGTINTRKSNINFKKEYIGTVDVLVELKKTYTNTKFSFVLGHDTYFDLLNGLWKKEDEIFNNIEKLYIIERKGVSRQNKKQNGTNFKKINNNVNLNKVIPITINELSDISSSKIRKYFSNAKEIINNSNNSNNSNTKLKNIFEKLNTGLYKKVFDYIIFNKDVFDYYSKH